MLARLVGPLMGVYTCAGMNTFLGSASSAACVCCRPLQPWTRMCSCGTTRPSRRRHTRVSAMPTNTHTRLLVRPQPHACCSGGFAHDAHILLCCSQQEFRSSSGRLPCSSQGQQRQLRQLPGTWSACALHHLLLLIPACTCPCAPVRVLAVAAVLARTVSWRLPGARVTDGGRSKETTVMSSKWLCV